MEEAILRSAKRASLEKISDLHWEFLLSCWNRNLKEWAEAINPIVKLAALGLYAYLRTVHGRKSFNSWMKFIGLPGFAKTRSVAWKRCEPDYCLPVRLQEWENCSLKQ